jgi:DNA repair exonuclease SbcCD nuclease subunit
MKRADAIFFADPHFREQTPVARTDDFEAAQWRKLDFIIALQKKHKCGVYIAGDFFDHWKPSPELLSKLNKKLPDEWHSIYGDHDIPQKNMRLIVKSGLYNLKTAGKINIVRGGHGTDKNNHELPSGQKPSAIIKGRKILLWHVLTWKKELPFPDCKNKSAKFLLKNNPKFDCIVTGDNHKPFTEEYKGRLLVNCGSMMRNNADQNNYRPAVWLYYAYSNTVKKAYLPIEQGVVSREHIDDKKKRDGRIDAFVSSIDPLSGNNKFVRKLEECFNAFYQKNNTRKEIRDIINKYI